MHDLCHRDGGPLFQGLVFIQFLFQHLEGIIYWDLCKETSDIKADELVCLVNVDVPYSVNKVCGVLDCVGVLAYEGGWDSGQFLGQVVGGRPYGGDNGSHWDLFFLDFGKSVHLGWF